MNKLRKEALIQNALERCRFTPKAVRRIAQCLMSRLPVIIKGVQGPTVKTSLCRELRSLGICAVEEWELSETPESDFVKEFIKERDSNNCCITITLNERIV